MSYPSLVSHVSQVPCVAATHQYPVEIGGMYVAPSLVENVTDRVYNIVTGKATQNYPPLMASKQASSTNPQLQALQDALLNLEARISSVV